MRLPSLSCLFLRLSSSLFLRLFRVSSSPRTAVSSRVFSIERRERRVSSACLSLFQRILEALHPLPSISGRRCELLSRLHADLIPCLVSLKAKKLGQNIS